MHVDYSGRGPGASGRPRNADPWQTIELRTCGHASNQIRNTILERFPVVESLPFSKSKTKSRVESSSRAEFLYLATDASCLFEVRPTGGWLCLPLKNSTLTTKHSP